MLTFEYSEYTWNTLTQSKPRCIYLGTNRIKFKGKSAEN